MKVFRLAAVIALGFAAPVLADPIEGVWKTQVDDGAYAHVTIAPCGGNFCGVISRTFNASGEYKSENIGKQLVRNMAAQGGGAYKGKVWRPSNNKIYIGKMTLNGDKLKLRGCVAGGLICSAQNWVRVQ